MRCCSIGLAHGRLLANRQAACKDWVACVLCVFSWDGSGCFSSARCFSATGSDTKMEPHLVIDDASEVLTTIIESACGSWPGGMHSMAWPPAAPGQAPCGSGPGGTHAVACLLRLPGRAYSKMVYMYAFDWLSCSFVKLEIVSNRESGFQKIREAR